MLPGIFQQAGQAAEDNNPLNLLVKALDAEHTKQTQAQGMREQQLAQPMPQKRNITLLEVLGTALAGAADGSKNRGASGNAFLGGLNQGIENKYQGDVQNYQRKSALTDVQAKGIEDQGAYGVKRAQAIYQGSEKNEAKKLQVQQRQEALDYKKQLDAEKSAQFLDTQMTKLNSQMNQATTFGDMKSIRDQMRAIEARHANEPGYVSLIKDDEQLKADYEDRQYKKRDAAARRWETALKGETDPNFGYALPGRIADLERQRQRIAKEEKVDIDTLRTVPTEQTRKKEVQDEKKREFNERLKFLGVQHRDNLAIKKANLEISKQRLAIYQTIAPSMLAIAQYNAELRRYGMENQQFNKAVDQDIANLQKKAAGLQRSLSAAPPELQAKIRAELDETQGQMDYLKGQKEDTQFDPLGDAIPGFAQPQPTQQMAPPPAFNPVPRGFSGQITPQGTRVEAVAAPMKPLPKSQLPTRVIKNPGGAVITVRG